ncbi:hypothetical protein BB737_04910 [Mycobacterium avium subsp. hominissuis]|uniref:Uncharacterized protein n=4 Tax=Mycobacterium TaxID=1763 RepID=A0AA37Q503_9MYCO|nr:hypothetical protein BST19_26115 [Mycobacterium bouchedurhonense]ORW07731.1 hypothetical protein AWC14_24455 [Mycobacterium kyorinense]PBJ35482.1 hypothetical protein XV03_10850 [Mycobacterium avium subsp. hominissuis]PBJ66939.1 hypothetical protein BB737_04910 [Mycobacterium avium subsp. hominissuis]GLB86737.1 hypothetical protein SRL2020028_59930 [Mycobacterium kiyosense]
MQRLSERFAQRLPGTGVNLGGDPVSLPAIKSNRPLLELAIASDERGRRSAHAGRIRVPQRTHRHSIYSDF